MYKVEYFPYVCDSPAGAVSEEIQTPFGELQLRLIRL